MEKKFLIYLNTTKEALRKKIGEIFNTENQKIILFTNYTKQYHKIVENQFIENGNNESFFSFISDCTSKLVSPPYIFINATDLSQNVILLDEPEFLSFGDTKKIFCLLQIKILLY